MAPSSIARQGNEDHTHSSMMAWRVHEFGPPDVMTFERIPRLRPRPGEVLVKVKAAGVGPWDGWIRAGKSALPQPLPLTLGSDLSGEVAAVESGDLRVGDQVYGVTNPQFIGAYAEYAVASAAMVSIKPTSLTYIEAASVPVIAVTAWQALFDQAQLKAGQRWSFMGRQETLALMRFSWPVARMYESPRPRLWMISFFCATSAQTQ